MAKTVSDEEIQLRKRARRRLVGAIALVVAAIVILPMLLDSKPEERSQEIDIHIPSEDSVEELEARRDESRWSDGYDDCSKITVVKHSQPRNRR